MLLAEKLAVISGAGSGIGRSVAVHFSKLGATVVATDVNKSAAEETCQLLSTSSTDQHVAVQCDVSGAEFVKQLKDFVVSNFKRPVNVLVNSAGITMDSRFHRMTEEQFNWVVDVNLKGTFLMTQAFTDAMVQAGAQNCSVINISSIVGKKGNFGQANYAASKAGVIGLTKTVALELAPKGIRVNAILPGFIKTPMTAKVPEKVLDLVLAQIPLGRLGEPEEIADVCAFLASDMSRYITGASIEVTGGLLM